MSVIDCGGHTVPLLACRQSLLHLAPCACLPARVSKGPGAAGRAQTRDRGALARPTLLAVHRCPAMQHQLLQTMA